jgi:hypothetical protein
MKISVGTKISAGANFPLKNRPQAIIKGTKTGTVKETS